MQVCSDWSLLTAACHTALTMFVSCHVQLASWTYLDWLLLLLLLGRQVSERYSLDGSTSKCRRRDFRRGKRGTGLQVASQQSLARSSSAQLSLA